MDRKDEVFHIVKGNAKSSYDLQLGRAHDINVNDKFLIFEKATFTPVFKEAVVSEAYQLSSCLQVQSTTLSQAFAVKAVPSLPIRIAMEHLYSNELDTRLLRLLGVELVADGEEKLKLVHSGGVEDTNRWMKFVFANSSPVDGTLYHRWPLTSNDEFYPIFAHIGHFYHQLHHMQRGASSIEIRLVAVVKDDGGIYHELLDCNPVTLCKCRQHQLPHLHVLADNKTKYGLKIANNSDRPLYFSFFYFDETTFSIGV
jgi:hypothetical protein